jgi:replication-associated recombination protein RarA
VLSQFNLPISERKKFMSNIPAQTKYAPQSMQDVVFNDLNSEFFLNQIALGRMPCTHLMLHGTSGNGKTCIANIIAQSLTNNSALLLNYSIEDFLKLNDIELMLYNTRTFYSSKPTDRCVIVFHELDKHKGSLARLWQIMDECEELLMVIFTTNNATDFETPVISRCDKYEFTQITPNVFASRAQHILSLEGISLSRSEVIYYLTTYTGHMCDVRDYMRTIDKIVALNACGRLPQAPTAAIKSKRTLTVAK